MSTVVTGARGFIAQVLLAHLRAIKTGTLRLVHRTAAPGMTAVDLLDAAATRRFILKSAPRMIYHLAGTTKPLPWEGLWDAHVRSTLNLLDAVSALPHPRRTMVVLCGSAAEYGSGGLPGPVRETDPALPLSAYGATKLCQSVAALSYSGLDVRVARVFNAIGPGIPERLALGAFAKQLADIKHERRTPVLSVGDLRPKRDFVDVRDVASALVAVARRGAPGQIYNVCSGKAVAIGWMLDRLIATTGLDVKIRHASSRKLAGVPKIFGSHAKLTRASGWRPRISIEDSLRDTLAWYGAI